MEVEIEEKQKDGASVTDQGPLYPEGIVATNRQRLCGVSHSHHKLYLRYQGTKAKNQGGEPVLDFVDLINCPEKQPECSAQKKENMCVWRL